VKLAALLVVVKAGKKAVPRDERMVDEKAGLKDETMVAKMAHYYSIIVL